MRRILALVLAALVYPAAVFSEDMPVKYRVALSEGGAGLVRGLTFHAPFTDPANPLTLYKGTGTLSLTRVHDNTHTATYIHPTTGYVTTADNNALRIEANGALIEGARTNLVAKSNDLTVAPWAEYGTPPTSVALDNADYPGGVLNQSTEIVNNDAFEGRRQNVILTIPTVYTASSWAKGAAGSEGIMISDALGTGGALTVSAAWARYTKTFTAAHTDVGVIISQAAVATVNYSGYQVEEASVASSYIPTTTVAFTRNADVLTIQSSGNIDNVASTIAFTWTPNWGSTAVVGTPVLFDIGGVKATYTAADDKINLTDGTNTVSTAALTFSANVAQKLAFRWGPGGLDIYRNGASAASGATFSDFLMNANLYIGSDVSGANQAYSNFENVRAWRREPSDAEMVGITQ